MLNDYIKYLKDNPEGYWFKRKLYGWGWVPVTWQGYAVVFAFILFIFFIANRFLTQDRVEEYFAALVAAAVILIAICWKTGEPPRWQWGIKDAERKKLKTEE